MATLQLSQIAAVRRGSIYPRPGIGSAIRWPLSRNASNFKGIEKSRPFKATSRDSGIKVPDVADGLVDQLLSLVEKTDRGAVLDKEQHALVSELVSRLERLNVPPEPLQSPLIFGDWDVSYCSNPTAPGGYYRSALGRLLLTTEEMVQTINPPDVVGNSVAFALFGAVRGRVSLRGKLVPVDQKSIEITFESPFLKFGPFENIRYGKNSTVKIAVLYVDERVRLGRGSRGSVFVFKRRTPSGNSWMNSLD